jgi:hypothetical protein
LIIAETVWRLVDGRAEAALIALAGLMRERAPLQN